jgi:MFS family permease
MDQSNIRTFTLLMALGTFVVVMDNTIMNVSVPALVEDLNTTVSGVQSAVALNALGMAAFVLLGGKLADIIGMKRTFMTGVFLYIPGTILASLSQNLATLILGWCIIQSFGAALMLPNVQTIIRASLDGEDRARAYGTMAGVNALGAAMGPIIGGFLTTYFSWRWALQLEVAFLLAVVLLQNVIPKDPVITERPGLDKLGTALQAGAMISIVLGILLISDYGLFIAKQPLIIAGVEIDPFHLGLSPVVYLLGLGVILLLLFVNVENKNIRENRPSLVHLALFKIIDFVNGLKVRSIQVSILAGILFAVPLFLQVSFGISAFHTGLALLPLSITIIIGAALGVRARKTRLPKTVVRLGALVMTFGALALVVAMNTGTSALDLSLGLSILGFGIGLVSSQIVNLTLSAVAPEQTAEASGITSTVEQVGNSVGVAILGTILTISLSLGLTQLLNANTSIPEATKQQATEIIEQGVDIVSDQQIQENIAGLDPELADEILSIYHIARTDAFRIVMFTVAFFSIVMFILSARLPAREL